MDLTVSFFHLLAFRFTQLASVHSFSHLLIVTCILSVTECVCVTAQASLRPMLRAYLDGNIFIGTQFYGNFFVLCSGFCVVFPNLILP